jgi:tetratricopeptide (TPR) repeat protein
MATVRTNASGRAHDDNPTSLPDIARLRRTDPTSLTRSLRGDLDWIVMKALEKDRTRRYETANELALDVERHLCNEPVAASPPGAGYRFHKMVRRNRGTVVAASLVIASLVLGIAGTSAGMVRAVRAERDAQEKAQIAESVNEFLNQDLLATVVPVAEENPEQVFMIRRALDVATKRIDEACRDGGRYANRPLVEASIRGTLGETYRRLGAYSDAEPHALRAVEICTTVLGDDHPNSLEAMKCLATVFIDEGRFDEAEALQLNRVRTQIRILGEEHHETLGSMKDLAVVYCGQGRFAEAEPLIIKSIEIEQRIHGDSDEPVLAPFDDLARRHLAPGRHDEAMTLYAQAIEIARRTLGEEHPATVRMIDEYERISRATEALRDNSKE